LFNCTDNNSLIVLEVIVGRTDIGTRGIRRRGESILTVMMQKLRNIITGLWKE